MISIIVHRRDGSFVGKFYGKESAMLQALIYLRLRGYRVNIERDD